MLNLIEISLGNLEMKHITPMKLYPPAILAKENPKNRRSEHFISILESQSRVPA
jgi:hypothetical protein